MSTNSSGKVAADQRFTASRPCPICAGHAGLPKGRETRCTGFLSKDGKVAVCSRVDSDNPVETVVGTCWRHRLDAPVAPQRTRTKGPNSKRLPRGHASLKAAVEAWVKYQAERPDEPKLYRLDDLIVLQDREGRPIMGEARFLPLGADGEPECDADTGKSRKDLRPFWKGPDGKWRLGDAPGKLPLLGLQVLAEAPRVFITEGPRKAKALERLGLVATAALHGARGARKTDWTPVADVPEFIVWPDNDAAGSEFERDVRVILGRVAPNASVRVLRFPDKPPKWDSFDYVAEGGTKDELLARIDALEAEPKEATDGLGATPGVVEADDDGHRLARVLLERHRHADGLTLAFYREDFCEWDGASYRVVAPSEMEAISDRCIKAEFDRIALESGRPAKKVTGSIVANTMRAVRAATLILGRHEAPCWRVAKDGLPDPRCILPTQDALVDLSTIRLRRDGTVDLGDVETYEPTPALFSRFHLDYRFDPTAPVPMRWLRFLDELWPGDHQSQRELQKWFGYLLTPDTRHQKMLYLIGPQRSGKGTVGRVLTRLIGSHSVSAPALMDLAGAHALTDAVGKLALVIGDARVAGTEGEIARIQERLLKISGEDEVEINPKYKTPFKTRLPSRIVILSNEVPAFRDPSGAFRSRARPLKLTRSFEGEEDHSLTDALTTPESLAGLLNWAIVGRGMLEADGGFLVPDSAQDLLRTIGITTNPMHLFLEEWADVEDSAAEEPVELLFAAYLQFCSESGNPARSVQIFGRNLRATEPRIEDGARKDCAETGRRHRHLRHIRLTRKPAGIFKSKAGYQHDLVVGGYGA